MGSNALQCLGRSVCRREVVVVLLGTQTESISVCAGWSNPLGVREGEVGVTLESVVDELGRTAR